MAMSRLSALSVCLLLAGSTAFAQEAGPPEAPAKPAQITALGPAKVEVEAFAGLYGLDHESADNVRYTPGGDGLFGGQVAVGLTRHLALQAGGSIARYQNDMYWQIEEPHNPYLAEARLQQFWGGLRYEFRQPAAVVRPYLAGGVIATTYANLHRGPKDVCVPGPGCESIAPELFEGTRVTGYFDAGINFMIWRRWGLGGGVRSFWLRGNDSDPNPNSSGSSGKDVFSYVHLYFGVLYRWR